MSEVKVRTGEKLHQHMQKYGYFVVSSDGEAPMGEIWPDITTVAGGTIEGPMVVVGESSKAEFEKQADELGLYGELPSNFRYFYRVAAE